MEILTLEALVAIVTILGVCGTAVWRFVVLLTKHDAKFTKAISEAHDRIDRVREDYVLRTEYIEDRRAMSASMADTKAAIAQMQTSLSGRIDQLIVAMSRPRDGGD